MKCNHSLAEKDTEVADGACPICLSARIALLEKVAEAAEVFGDYFNCIFLEFDDNQYVGEVGFQAHYFRDLHAALEAAKETK